MEILNMKVSDSTKFLCNVNRELDDVCGALIQYYHTYKAAPENEKTPADICDDVNFETKVDDAIEHARKLIEELIVESVKDNLRTYSDEI